MPATTATRDNLLDDIRNFGATARLKVCHMFFFIDYHYYYDRF
jgi:hypothetical protein